MRGFLSSNSLYLHLGSSLLSFPGAFPALLHHFSLRNALWSTVSTSEGKKQTHTSVSSVGWAGLTHAVSQFSSRAAPLFATADIVLQGNSFLTASSSSSNLSTKFFWFFFLLHHSDKPSSTSTSGTDFAFVSSSPSMCLKSPWRKGSPSKCCSVLELPCSCICRSAVPLLKGLCSYLLYFSSWSAPGSNLLPSIYFLLPLPSFPKHHACWASFPLIRLILQIAHHFLSATFVTESSRHSKGVTLNQYRGLCLCDMSNIRWKVPTTQVHMAY